MNLSENEVEIVASACHAAWYAYAVLALGEDGCEWLNAPQFQKDSIRDAVRFWCENTDRPDLERASHENWKRQRLSAGWKYGLSKNVESKTSPCLVQYECLPDAQRTKDTVVVQAFRATAGEIERQRCASA